MGSSQLASVRVGTHTFIMCQSHICKNLDYVIITYVLETNIEICDVGTNPPNPVSDGCSDQLLVVVVIPGMLGIRPYLVTLDK